MSLQMWDNILIMISLINASYAVLSAISATAGLNLPIPWASAVPRCTSAAVHVAGCVLVRPIPEQYSVMYYGCKILLYAKALKA